MKDVSQLSRLQPHAASKITPCSRKLLAISIAMIATTQVYAQPAAPTKGAFEEITVTAQRRTELAVDVPIAITSLDAEQLGQGDVQKLSDIGKLTPSLRFDNTGGFAQPTIRGVGTAVVVAGGGSNVAVYTDGFYSPNPIMANNELLNIKSIQVLKGPQGTLFGRNSTGGAILVSTSDPSSTESVDAEISYGNYNAQTYKVYATGGASDTLAFDIAGSLRKGDGFIDNIVTGSDKDGEYENSAIRLGAKLELSDKFSVLFRYTHTDTDDAYPVNTNSYKKDGQVYSTAAFLDAAGFIDATVATKPDEVANGYRPLFTSQDDTVQLTLKADLDFALLTSYTQYRDEIGTHHHDFDTSSAEIFHYKYDTTDKIFTQEFLLSSLGESKLQWTTGLFYFDDETAFEKNSGSQGGAPFSRTGGSGVTSRSLAVFGDATYALLDDLYLTAGLRYSKDKITDAFFKDQATGTTKTKVPDVDDDELTPRIALRYEINPSSSVYASYTEGFKSGILNVGGGTLVDIEVKPEEIKAYEIGYKYSAGDLMFDVATFYYDYKNLQVASYVGPTSVIQNAANSTVYGLDGQIRYAVTEQFEINFGAAYLHAEYDDFEKSQVWAQCTDLVICGLGYGTYIPSYADASGKEMQHSPELTATLGASYKTDVAGGALNISGTLYHTSEFYFDSSEAYKEDAYDLLSLRAAWTDPSGHYTFAVFGDNLTDEEYHTQVLPQQLGTLTTWGTPRTFGVSLGLHY